MLLIRLLLLIYIFYVSIDFLISEIVSLIILLYEIIIKKYNNND
jgi:hypothetical protein